MVAIHFLEYAIILMMAEISYWWDLICHTAPYQNYCKVFQNPQGSCLELSQGQYPLRRLLLRSCKDPKLANLWFALPSPSHIWQAVWQHWCLWACQISKLYYNFSYDNYDKKTYWTFKRVSGHEYILGWFSCEFLFVFNYHFKVLLPQQFEWQMWCFRCVCLTVTD